MRNTLSLLLLTLSTTAFAAGGHSHGKAELDIALDGNTLTLALEAPLESLVGFERAPKNANEQERVKKAAEKLRAADKLFVISADAACKLQSVKLASAVIDPALLGEAPAANAAGAKAAGAKEEGHADLDGEFVFRCDKPAAVKSVTVNLFDAFSLLQRVDARAASAKGQHAAKLNGKSRTLSW
ncbi:DUF2796 domain-containing protein [Viridibacterium curvum]